MISWSVLWLLLALSITVSLGLRLENLTQHQVACTQAKAPGLCRGRQLRYAYNKETYNCVSFYYTGCASTDNNFLTYEECRRDCMLPRRY